MSCSRRCLGHIAGFATLFGLPLLSLAAAPPPAIALYTRAQADRGADLYEQHCSACHGPNLSGSRASAMKGESFLARWGTADRTLQDFFDTVRTTMPYGNPDSLTEQEYLDITAYVLSGNGHPAGPQELSARFMSRASLRPGTGVPEFGSNPGRLASFKEPAVTFIETGIKPTSKGPTQQELNAAALNTTDWLYTNHDYAGWRYVDLKQITRDNIKGLRPVAMFQIGDTNAFHNNPLVYQGVMYVATTYSTIAIDAVTAKLLWRFDRKSKAEEGWPLIRGVSIKDGMVVRGTRDGYLFALDAKTGKLIWERMVSDRRKNEAGFTMAPVLWEDLILIGPAGSELGIKGWFGAFKLSNGEPVWRFNTVPDDNEFGADTWSTREGRMQGGGAVWAPLSFDKDKGLVYVPVANPYPDYEGEKRQGKNLYTNSMLVLDARTGKLQWYYQAVPHDLHDYDLTQVSPLFEASVKGKPRKLVAVVGKDALLHVLDRETKEHLYEVPVARRYNNGPQTSEGVHTCPGALGGVQYNGPAYNPGTNMLYVPVVDWCYTFTKITRGPDGRRTGGSNQADPIEKSNGVLTAIDASSGKVSWQYKSARPMLAAVTTTSANLVFTGELTGDMLALDAKTGEVVYRFNTGAPNNGGIITYAIGGKQYVAIASGNATAFWRAQPAAAQIIIFALN